MCQRRLTSPAASCVSHCMLGAMWRSENTSWNASLKRSVVSGLLQFGDCLQGPYQYRLIPIHLLFQGILHSRFLHVGNISPLKSLSCISQGILYHFIETRVQSMGGNGNHSPNDLEPSVELQNFVCNSSSFVSKTQWSPGSWKALEDNRRCKR